MFVENFVTFNLIESEFFFYNLSNRPVFLSQFVNEKFKYSKNCPLDIHKMLHSHSIPEKAPACARASKLYDWVSGEIPKNCSEGWVGPYPEIEGGAK